MNHTSKQTLPIISIAPWLPSSTQATIAEKAETARSLHEACLKYGFFYLDITSFASKEETDELESLARQFFGQDQEKKDRISISKGDHARGVCEIFCYYMPTFFVHLGYVYGSLTLL